MEHFTTSAIYGNCSVPPAHSVGEPAHLVGTTLFCAAHCSHCSPVLRESDEPIAPVEGEQAELFGGLR